MTDPIVERLLPVLMDVRGIAAVVLGGSRARGTARQGSDYDIGLYYDPADPFEVPALAAAVARIADEGDAVELTPIGGWGPWINGGAWITVAAAAVDLLYRDLAAVNAVVDAALRGEFTMAYQAGHPHVFASTIWIGEVAVAVPLHDPAGAFAALRSRVLPFPEPLRRSLVERFSWEARFALGNARKALERNETTYVAGCAFRVLSSLAQVLFALNRCYLINEKGALTEAAALPSTLPGLESDVRDVWRRIGCGELEGALESLEALLDAQDKLVSTTVSPVDASR